MASPKKSYVCSNCGNELTFKVGICPQCRQQGTYELKEVSPQAKKVAHVSVAKPMGVKRSKATHITNVSFENAQRLDTTIAELNRVLGGGLVPGSILLLGGEPGAGKSTLLLETASRLSHLGVVLYVSGEESEAQIKMRAERLEIQPGELYVVFENNLEEILETHIPEVKPMVVIVDSINTVGSSEVSAGVGSPTQVKHCSRQFQQLAKSTGMSVLMIGHVTKSGDIAGPNTLAHDVDAVLYLEGDRFQLFRLLRAEKNRFGSVGEVGVFEMTERGMVEVPNPSEAFLAERAFNKPGSSVAVTVEGSRPIVAEVQALCALTAAANPMRRANGINRDRLYQIAMVLDKYIPVIDLGDRDILMSAVGGMRIEEPSADLALACAIFSSWHETPTPAEVVAIAEVGLTGELRTVPQIEIRLREAAKLGFKRAIVPKLKRSVHLPTDIDVVQVKTLEEAMRAIFVGVDFDGAAVQPPQDDKPKKRPALPRPDMSTNVALEDAQGGW